MAKIVRGPTGPKLRDDKGQYTAVSFTTKDGREVWISNKAVRAAVVLVALLCAVFVGSAQPGLAKVWPEVIKVILRGSVE